MPTELNVPLTEDELTKLDDFLLSSSEGGGRMPVDEAHGFITALIISHLPVGQTAWQSAVWGDPVFANEAEKECMTDLLQRMRNDIAATLQAGHPFEPLVIEEDSDGEVTEDYDGWCIGFMHAVTCHQEHWEKLPKNEHELLSPIAKLALLSSEEEVEMEADEYEMCIELIPGTVAGLYSHWESEQPTMN
ncbi:Branched-chain amino acid ABC transporter, amino acid-binding protein (TC 3.A.1.4.1) [hydrothermal vent metagenome]|uniref:Branched-chain amino acid ABC transporter, amino acid-binding protein (TC 3.A.1.4.1) n=1 Tax=hydrothermal vent metagenome TaxID=652676 RepID=A0A3B1AYY0_9ZZZZ